MLADLIPRRFGAPGFLFAAAASGDSDRSAETLGPLSLATGVELNVRFPAKNFGQLAEHLVSKPEYADNLTVICWHHECIPGLARALGVPGGVVNAAPPILPDGKWDAAVFDLFWRIDGAGALASLTVTKQEDVQ